MSIQNEYGSVEVAEADHWIASNLANFSYAIRLQHKAISESGRTFTSEQTCALLDEIDARIETSRRHSTSPWQQP
jgi:hypothetical protein